MPPRRFFLPVFLCCAALSPAAAELTEATADDLYVLRHWEENRGNAGTMNAGESTKLLVSPDGQHKAEYFQDGCGQHIHEFRLYHKRDGKWYTTLTTSGADYYTHKFFTRYAHVAAMLNNARHIRLLLAGGKVNPRLPDTVGKYAWELTEDEECRQLLLTAAGTPDSAATLRHLRVHEDGFKEWEPEPLKKFLEPTNK